MENATTFRKDDRGAADSRFASAEELHTLSYRICGGLEMIREKRGLDDRGKAYAAYMAPVLDGPAQKAVARDRVRDPVECTDKDIDLVMHRDKDMNMFHLDQDFNVPVWACGQPGTYSCYCHVRWCVLCLEVSEEPNSSRRSPACRGGAQPYRVRWGYGLGRVWPWAGGGVARRGEPTAEEVASCTRTADTGLRDRDDAARAWRARRLATAATGSGATIAQGSGGNSGGGGDRTGGDSGGRWLRRQRRCAVARRRAATL
ncbi:hypothetical protein Scep_017041 [Stephania cephalantha]|uniref:Uncharacterized protein n=1 Tax=Stephania cephalantha TaxID=152367 RepID=A0AAP0INT6_9MAGN